MENLRIYDQVRTVPDQAKKTIKGGRLRGMTDVNPMWRIKKLTELFGPAGIGWKTKVLERWTDTASTGEVVANVRIGLQVKTEEGWSEVIEGAGGSMLVAKEKDGLRADDEAWKKATTDALSVCCKLLGMAADVYWDRDTTKYSPRPESANVVSVDLTGEPEPSELEIKTFVQHCKMLNLNYVNVMKDAGWRSGEPWTREEHARALCILRDIENGK